MECPPEIILVLSDHLPEADEICLSLTCKALFSLLWNAKKMQPDKFTKQDILYRLERDVPGSFIAITAISSSRSTVSKALDVLIPTTWAYTTDTEIEIYANLYTPTRNSSIRDGIPRLDVPASFLPGKTCDKLRSPIERIVYEAEQLSSLLRESYRETRRQHQFKQGRIYLPFFTKQPNENVI
ncbi:hypothetical protein GGS26DRAFT_596590 [Hypomontagnella submonticulosa]|nr:hypothetical protein GGS26DRAFT_596590 [Hypomontagnella submonticulosa]